MTNEIALSAVISEFITATQRYGKFASAHEGYAVVLEELDELWDEVKKSPKKRDAKAMALEAKQTAAMALRFLVDVCADEDFL